MNRSLIQSGLYLIALCLLALLLYGCGGAAAESAPQEKAAVDRPEPGIHIDLTAEAWLRTEFEAVKACGKFEQGEFADITIAWMSPIFSCPYYPAGCEGEYVPPFTIKLGSYRSWRHEVIHHLLYQNTGDADARHASDLFARCG